jgi:hypothetical protein
MALILSPISITETITAPDISQLTTKSLTGTGVFDVLMSTVSLHLLEEFKQGRITGEEYTTVYLGALTAVLQQSNAFLANHHSEAKIRAEIGLMRQKTVTELAQTDDDIPLGLGFNTDTAIEGLVAQQVLLNASNIELSAAKVESAERESVLIGQKIITELAQTDDSDLSAAALVYGLNDDPEITGMVAAQITKTESESDLIIQKLVTEVSNTSDTKPIGLGEMDSVTVIGGLAKSQRDKIDSETDLLTQKTETEMAQTVDSITAGPVAGVVGKQKTLYTAQTDGFARDAEQKAAKLMLDTWSVSATVSEATANATNHLQDSDVGAVVTVLKAGVGT